MSDIEKAIRQIADEKNIPYEMVIGTIEAALAAAYRKDFGEKNQNIKVEFDATTGGSRVFDEKTVVTDDMYDDAIKILEDREVLRAEGKLERSELTEEEREKEKEITLYPKLHISLEEAKKIKKDAESGEILHIELQVPESYGRMAAQTAKQVIIQRIRETEREIVFEEFKENEGAIMIGSIARKEGRIILVDIGKTTGVMLADDQIPREFYRPGQRLKVYIKSVEKTPKGPQILVSRTHPDIVAKLFESEIPEIASGVVEIKGVAREAGSRSKVAVYTKEENIDPIGSCIGQRGARIQTIISELGGEKVDVVMYNDDARTFITNALSPAKVLNMEIDEKDKTAIAKVAPDQFSLAIGKNGQNVRLAARLTGWKINVKEDRDDDIKPAEISIAPEDDGEPSIIEGGGTSEELSSEEEASKKKKTSKKKVVKKEEVEEETTEEAKEGNNE
ncbi:MAG: transcription termination/antitermination protein NusA [Parcubacteria group bacterium CG10_big_fil_rev_8_21_14_0_10_36_14]|nr:MAG: transcription termination/antitermination protein NusA [Parcubacteria group bacterium CG10_big_fil_rev_8_21_14_0_10_36_14]